MDLEAIRKLAAKTAARCEELDKEIERLRHDYNSLRAAVIYLNDVLDGDGESSKGGKRR